MTVVDDELFCEFVVSRLLTEVSGMRIRSVIASVNVAYDRRQHLSLSGLERVVTFHEAPIELD